MKDETIFRKVLCSDRLPKQSGWYKVNLLSVNLFFEPENLYHKGSIQQWVNPNNIIEKPIWWLEEISLNQIKAEAWQECMTAIEKHEKEFGLWFIDKKTSAPPPRPINPYLPINN